MLLISLMSLQTSSMTKGELAAAVARVAGGEGGESGGNCAQELLRIGTALHRLRKSTQDV